MVIGGTAHQLPARLVFNLANQIPKRHVESTDRTDAKAPPTGHSRSTVHFFP